MDYSLIAITYYGLLTICAVSRAMQASRYPFIALIMLHQGRMQVVARFQGLPVTLINSSNDRSKECRESYSTSDARYSLIRNRLGTSEGR
jgi:hypothetical protein